MSTQMQKQIANVHKLAFVPAQTRLLQRKCACGPHTGSSACAECKKQEESILQRAAVNTAPTAIAVPPIVHDVLNSPGQPLDAGTRAFMEPRFGHDFSGVRVHTNTRAAESARAVNALAYTVGNNVVFGAGQYMPWTSEGRRLMAHELTHVVQQNTARSVKRGSLALGTPGDASEREADALSAQILQQPVSSLEDAEVRDTVFYQKVNVNLSDQKLQGRWGKQCSNLNDAIFDWIRLKYVQTIMYEYSSTLTNLPPTFTTMKIWKLPSQDGELDTDIYFKSSYEFVSLL